MWGVAYTHALKEFVAKTHLEQQGVTVFLPCYSKEGRGKQAKPSIKALFPRYIFIQLSQTTCLRAIRYTRGIQYLLENQRYQPQTVPNEFISSLQAQTDESSCIHGLDDTHLQPGSTVYIHSGQFSGQCAHILSIDENQRVQLLLELLGTKTKITLNTESLQAL